MGLLQERIYSMTFIIQSTGKDLKLTPGSSRAGGAICSFQKGYTVKTFCGG